MTFLVRGSLGEFALAENLVQDAVAPLGVRYVSTEHIKDFRSGSPQRGAEVIRPCMFMRHSVKYALN